MNRSGTLVCDYTLSSLMNAGLKWRCFEGAEDEAAYAILQRCIEEIDEEALKLVKRFKFELNPYRISADRKRIVRTSLSFKLNEKHVSRRSWTLRKD